MKSRKPTLLKSFVTKTLTALVLTVGSIVTAFLTHAESQTSKTVRIGTTPGDFADLAKDGLAPLLERKGYKVTVREFSDYVTPNIALAEGSLELNIFQHKPYLTEFASGRDLALKELAQVPTAPLGLYAGRLKTLAAIKEKAIIGVPNDPTNLARALGILENLGWIEFDKKTNSTQVDTGDIRKNPKQLKILLLEPAQIPRSLRDLDYAVINGNYALSSGLSLADTLARETDDASERYINWAVTTESLASETLAHDTIEALNSEEFKRYAYKRFKDYRFPTAWKKTAGKLSGK
jgi:D-methionine transport system substrate-binding protein